MALVKLNVGGIQNMPPIKLAQLLGVDPETQSKLLKMQVTVSEHKAVFGDTTTIVVSANDPSGSVAHVDTKIPTEKLVWATSDGYQLGKGAIQLAFVEAINTLWKMVTPMHVPHGPTPDEPLSAIFDAEEEKKLEAKPLSTDMLLKQMLNHPPIDWGTVAKDLTKVKKPSPTAMSIKEATEMLNAGAMKASPPLKMPTGSYAVSTSPQNRVKLRYATELYQPVFGTDGESMYHVIALGKGLNAAGRIRTNNGVSIRMEGDFAANDAFRQKAVAAGFTLSGEEHLSMHVQADSEQHAVMALGAMLASVPFNFDQSAPALKAILYKGV